MMRQTDWQHGSGERDFHRIGGKERDESRAERGTERPAGAGCANHASQATPQANTTARPAAIARSDVR